MDKGISIALHTQRQSGNFSDAFNAIEIWINNNLSPSQVLFINSIYNHYNNDCMINVYYNENKPENKDDPRLTIHHSVVRDDKKWVNHLVGSTSKIRELFSK